MQKQIEQTCKKLYQKLCATSGAHPSDHLALWLRLHLLLQTHQALTSTPCTPEQLLEMINGTSRRLDTHAPAIRSLLPEFPLRHPYALPRELLTAFCTLYRTSFVPDLGNLYQWVQPMSDKKRKGQVFTPEFAVQHAFSLLRQPVHGRVLDLSCGGGDYLLLAYRKLRARYEAAGWSVNAAHAHILQHQLYGLDNDPLAVAITRSRLALECLPSPMVAPNLTALNAYQVFRHPLGQQSYDLIVGNPPWGSQLNAEDRRLLDRPFFPVANACKRNNSFLYFLEASVRLLNRQGLLSLLLPAAFLNVQSYAPLRRWLLQQMEIDVLHYVPELFDNVFAPALFLCGRKTTPRAEHRIDLIKPVVHRVQHSNLQPLQKQAVRQQVFLQQPQAVLNIHYDPGLEPLFKRMHDRCFYLQSSQMNSQDHVVDYVLGIVTGNNRHHLLKQPGAENGEPIYLAEDVSRFRLNKPKSFIIYDKRRLQQAAPKHKYKAPEKLLYKFISKELVVAIDRCGHYTVNNVNFILPVLLPVSLRYLAGLLNSKLLNTYYMYRFFTGKVITSHLCTLPLKLPSPAEARAMEALVARIEQSPPHEHGPLMQGLNDMVYRLYQVTAHEQAEVERKYEQLRHLPFV